MHATIGAKTKTTANSLIIVLYVASRPTIQRDAHTSAPKGETGQRRFQPFRANLTQERSRTAICGWPAGAFARPLTWEHTAA